MKNSKNHEKFNYFHYLQANNLLTLTLSYSQLLPITRIRKIIIGLKMKEENKILRDFYHFREIIPFFVILTSDLMVRTERIF